MSEFYESINISFTAHVNINRLKSNSNLNSAKILSKIMEDRRNLLCARCK